MNLTTERTFILTLTENEASTIAQFLDDVISLRNERPEPVVKLLNMLNTELMEVQ